MRALVLALAILALSHSAEARARHPVSSGFAHACPRGTAYPDGCSGAPLANPYTVQHPDFFTLHAPQNGQIYPWAALAGKSFNSPGIDYPVGANAAQAANFAHPTGASDPTVQANWNAINSASPSPNCQVSYQGRAWVECTGNLGSSTLVIDGFDWSPQGNAAGLSTGLFIANGQTATCTLSNNNFDFDSTVYPQDFPVRIIGCATLNSVNNRWHTAWPNSSFAAPGVDPGNSEFLTWTVTNGVEYYSRYNAFVNCPVRCVGFTAPATIDIAFDYYEGVQAVDTQELDHGDGYIVSAPSGFTINQYSYRYTTWLQPGFVNSKSTGLITLLENAHLSTFYGSFTTGSNILTIVTNSVSLPNGTTLQVVQGSIPYPNGWTIASGGPSVTGPFTLNTPAISTATNTEMYAGIPVTVASTDIEGNVIVTNQTTANSPYGAGVNTMSAVIEFAYAEYQSVTIKNNYIDPAGSGVCISTSTPYMDPSPTVSGNVNLTDGTPVTLTACNNHH